MSDSFDLDDLDFDDAPPLPPVGDTSGGLPPYMQGLNPPQQEAVETTEGPVLVLAGAGTGKTRVLTTRLGHLLATGRAQPWNMLAVTFTNKAANEMKERVAGVVGGSVEGMWIGTFHSICVKILRRHAELVGLESNFTILDTDDQIRLLKQLISAENIDDKRWPARMLAGLIDRWKNKALTPDRIPEGESYAYGDGKGQKLYKAYQARLKVLNACDFGDLLMHVIHILQNHKDVLAQYHNQFRYILVDEYQDTNVAQYLWLRLLAQATNNICCVGDDDQSIYGWRGAEVGNILRFSEDFPGAKTVRLEQNYRSTGHILAAASAMITKNEGRLGKTLWTDAGDGEKVSVKGVWDGRAEAEHICSDIESNQSKGHSLSETAILVRASFQMREFEARFMDLGLPYRVVGGPRFYERAEIRDAMAYLRVIAQPKDSLAFERIINVPKRGIGKTTVLKLHNHANEFGISLSAAARHMVDNKLLPAKARTAISNLLYDFDRWREFEKSTHDHIELAHMVLDESGYTDMWQRSEDIKKDTKLDNLKELVSALGEFENLAGFLEHISLVMENDQNPTDQKVTLMTLHAAKGLEFDTVYLPGWEEGVFPNQRALDETGLKGLEEERRLAYVGITRAKKKANIFYAGSRFVNGRWESYLPSRFVDELPPEHVDVEAAQGLYGNTGGVGGDFSDGWGSGDTSYSSYQSPNQSKYGPGWKRAENFKSYTPKNTYRAGPKKRYSEVEKARKNAPKTINATAKEVSKFAVGERVFHQKFGYGIVEDVEGNKLLIEFEKAGAKRVMDNFVEST